MGIQASVADIGRRIKYVNADGAVVRGTLRGVGMRFAFVDHGLPYTREWPMVLLYKLEWDDEGGDRNLPSPARS